MGNYRRCQPMSGNNVENAHAQLYVSPTLWEDFLLYTELDPNGRFIIGSYKIACTGLTPLEDARVYADKGIDYFGATFEHRLKVTLRDANPVEGESMPTVVVWAISNVIEDGHYWGQNASQAVYVTIQYSYIGSLWIALGEAESGASDVYVVSSGFDIPYYLTIERTGETTIECRIYSDASRLALVDTLSVAVPSGRRYRYIFATNSANRGIGTGTISADVEQLEL